jgi:hypothetical protein
VSSFASRSMTGNEPALLNSLKFSSRPASTWEALPFRLPHLYKAL